MEEQKTNTMNPDAIAGLVRTVGMLILFYGVFLLVKAELTEIEVSPKNIDAETLIRLPIEIAEKAENTILGGFLIVIGIQLCLVTTKLILEIKEHIKRHS